MLLKMVPLLLFHLFVFVGRTSSGVVPQNFKSLDNKPSDLEAIFTNNGKNVSNTTVDNSELHNESSSVLVDVENLKASITNLHNISDSDNVENTIPEKSHVVKNISRGSGRSKMKVSKESKKKRESFNKTFREESDHGDANNVKATASIEDHPEDFHHNNISKKFDHLEHNTNSHFDNISDHSEDLTLKSDHLNNGSKSFDHDLNVVNTEFNTTSIGDRNNSEEIISDVNHFHQDHLNDSVADLNKQLNEVTENVLKEFNDTLKTALELNNHKETSSDAPKTFENQTDHLGHMENSHNTLKQLNQTAVSLSNSSKRFLNIHNSFMKLNPTDKTDSTLLNPSKNAANIHDRLDTAKIDKKSFEKTSETEINSEGSKSSDIQIDLAPNIIKKMDSTNLPLSDMKDNGVSHEDNGVGHKEDEVGHKDGVGHKEDGVEHKADGVGHKEDVVGHKEDGVGHKEDGVGHKEDGVGHKEDGVGHKDNESGHETNSDILDTVVPNDDDLNVTSELPGEVSEIKVNINNSDLINRDIKEPIIVSETNETQGLFSSLGLDFLMNSELAKNAASAMEVFNFSDSALTDHIVDDKNDMHDFLDLIPLEHNENQSDQTPSTSSTIDAEGTDTESSTLDAESSTLVTESSSSSEIVLTTTSSPPILNSTVELEVTTLPSQIILNSTVEYEVTTLPSQLLFNSTIEYEETTTISPPLLRNGTEITNDAAKCPPPGFCIFWFLGQDTCTVNSHCLGSRICCQIGCTKTCIEV